MLEKILTEISKLTILGFIKKCWERFNNRQQNSENASHDYNSPYKKRHGQLQVFCVGMEAQSSLDDVYVAIQFLDRRRATRHTSLEEVEEAFRESGRTDFTSTSDERQDGMRVANNEQYLMVLGGPGVGKSTFLRKVGVEALKREDGSFEHESTPVFLELKRFTKDPVDIEAWITEEFKVCGHPHPEQWANSKLKSGELLILFDGLDEVPKSNVNNVINKIRDFVHQYSQNRFIASCRVGAYKGGLTDFAVVEMADFDDSQIQGYINNWFASASNRKMKTAQRCWQALNASDHQTIKVLAQNPLSLALLCKTYEDSQGFPSSQVNLYEDIFNIFLEEWAEERGVRRDPSMNRYLAIPTVKKLLSEIAAENFKANRLVFSKNELIDQIQEFYQRRTDISSGFDASKILGAILVDPGLFVEQANGIYSFFHLTFQEYLTANHIVGDKRSIQDLVNQHLLYERWREVFLLTAGLMREADDLLEAMKSEAAEYIDTDGLKTLFQWAERIADTTEDGDKRIIKQAFAVRQYFSLWLLNKIDEEVKEIVNHDLDQIQILYENLDFTIYDYLDRDPYIYDLTLDLMFYQDLALCLYRDPTVNTVLHQYLHRYLCFNLYVYRYIDVYQDFYRYMDTDFYPHAFAVSADRFDEELQKRITFVERMEQMKIFKGVDLQQMVQRFNTQREFIKAARAGKSVEPPGESIHDTWLAVLGITDGMLAISDEELENCYRYLRAVELIIECKEAARNVSPEVWQEIEDRLLRDERTQEVLTFKMIRDL